MEIYPLEGLNVIMGSFETKLEKLQEKILSGEKNRVINDDGRYLNEQLKDCGILEFPTNTIVCKGRCGIGGTSFELQAKRNSIILVPLKSIVKSKMNGKILGVYGDIKDDIIINYFKNKIPCKKIVCTAESLRRLVDLAKSLEIDLFQDYVVVFDEYHSIITEYDYREKLADLDLFFKFQNKILISATPINIQHPKFEKFNRLTIVPQENPTQINLNLSHDPYSKLLEHIIRYYENNNEIHVFINDIGLIKDYVQALTRSGIPSGEISIKISSDSRRTHDVKYFESEGVSVNVKSQHNINFYTSAYFEGWDLFSNSHVVRVFLYSDPNNQHLCTHIGSRGYQAISRLRGIPVKVHHFIKMLSKDKQEEYIDFHIEPYKEMVYERSHNIALAYDKMKQIDVGLARIIKESFLNTYDKYTCYDDQSDSFTPNYFGLEYLTYQKESIADYVNIGTIEAAWRKLKFSGIIPESDEAYATKPPKSKLRHVHFEEIYEALESGESAILEKYDKDKIYEAKLAYKVLGIDQIRVLKHNHVDIFGTMKKNLLPYIAKGSDSEFDGFKEELYSSIGQGSISSDDLKKTFDGLFRKYNIPVTAKGNCIQHFYKTEIIKSGYRGNKGLYYVIIDKLNYSPS